MSQSVVEQWGLTDIPYAEQEAVVVAEMLHNTFASLSGRVHPFRHARLVEAFGHRFGSVDGWPDRQ